jgi:hypothetical protein
VLDTSFAVLNGWNGWEIELLVLRGHFSLVLQWYCCLPGQYVFVGFPLEFSIWSRMLLYWRAEPVDIIQPTLSLPWLTTPICGLIALNLLMHYYYVCTIYPGFIDDPPREPGHGIFWAKKKGRSRNNVLTGVWWSDDRSVLITPATTSKCKRCGQLKPEVSDPWPRRDWRLTT